MRTVNQVSNGYGASIPDAGKRGRVPRAHARAHRGSAAGGQARGDEVTYLPTGASMSTYSRAAVWLHGCTDGHGRQYESRR